MFMALLTGPTVWYAVFSSSITTSLYALSSALERIQVGATRSYRSKTAKHALATRECGA